MNYADARKRMVDGQLRPNRVTDARLLDAMRSLPREQFLPPALHARAYADEDVALPGGRAMLQPMTLGRLLQAAAVRPDDRVLAVCAGTGYGAAVLAWIGARVIALEEDAALAALARQALAAHLPAGTWRLETGRCAEGFAAAAPYDVILIEGEVPAVPEALAAQLAEGGRLVTVLGGRRQGTINGIAAGATRGAAVLARRIGGSVSVASVFDCAAPTLAAFAPARGFVF